MSTNNMSDEELDRLFRKSADHYDPPFDEEAWAAMERKLDGAQTGSGGGIKRYLSGALLALLVLVGIGWIFLEDGEPLPEDTAIPEVQEDKRNPELVAIPDQAKNVEHSALPEPESPAAPHPAVQPGSGNRSAEKTVQKRNAIPEPLAIPAKRLKSATAIPAAAITNSVDEPMQTIATGIARSTRTEPNTGIAHQVTPLPIPDQMPIPSDNSQAMLKQERVFLRSVGVTLVAAPDFTTVRFKNRDAVSTNAGVLISVPITPKWSLVSGAVWANKLYKATPADYKPSPDYWYGKHEPDVIRAECKVLDIPVNLQYQVLGWGKNMLTVQAGLSSYLMLKEAYTYTYYYPGKEPYRHTRAFSNENRHWFGVQNLSVGYKRQLSPAITIGAEPFVKIPLASIGEGRVKLTSAGVFFTAGYTLK